MITPRHSNLPMVPTDAEAREERDGVAEANADGKAEVGRLKMPISREYQIPAFQQDLLQGDHVQVFFPNITLPRP